MENKPSLLFVTTDLPYPANSGGRIKTWALLKFLCEHFNVKLVCAYGGERNADIKAVRDVLPLTGFQAFEQHLPRTKWQVFKAYMYSPTLNAHRIFSDEIVSMVNWSGQSADVVIVDHLECYHLLPEKFKGKVIYHSHNAEFKLWAEAASFTSNPIKKWLLNWEAKRVKALEKYAISRSVFTFMAPNDQIAIQGEIGFKDEAFRPTLHLGNDALLDLPDIALKQNPKQVFYAGTLSWEPNRDGLQWFLQRCWPAIVQKVPDAVLKICGAGASPDLKSLIRHTNGVEYLGFVNDLEAVMRTSGCAIVPLRMGSGTKIKTFDAMYRGLPLITTAKGAEGIDLVNKTHAWVVDGADAFSEAVISTLENKDEATAIRNQARLLCNERYRYKQLFEHMLADIKSVIA